MNRTAVKGMAGPGRRLLSTSHPPRTARVGRARRRFGLVALCGLTEWEVLYSARSAKDREAIQERLNQFTWCPMPEGIYRRARVVQGELTAKGEHRSAGAVDLLVAATAEAAGLTLLHYDRDVDTIVRTTGQPVRMIDLK